jgi:hypothetical protein
MFGWWFDLRPLARAGMASVLLLVSTGMWFAGWFWPWGWVVGVVMLLASFPSDSEKKGYHF